MRGNDVVFNADEKAAMLNNLFLFIAFSIVSIVLNFQRPGFEGLTGAY